MPPLSFSVGEAASWMGISNSGLRFLESKGIVHPYRDEQTGYRYFSKTDLALLGQLGFYKRAGLELVDARTLLESGSQQALADIHEGIDEMRRKLRDAEERVAVFEAMLDRIGLPSYAIETRPHFRYLHDPDYVYPPEATRDEMMGYLVDVMGRWKDFFPWVSMSAYYESGPDGYRFTRGNVIEDDVLKGLDLPQCEGVQDIPQRPNCLYVNTSHSYSIENDSVLGPAFAWATEHGYSCNGDIVERILYLQVIDSDITAFSELWIPLDEAD